MVQKVLVNAPLVISLLIINKNRIKSERRHALVKPSAYLARRREETNQSKP